MLSLLARLYLSWLWYVLALRGSSTFMGTGLMSAATSGILRPLTSSASPSRRTSSAGCSPVCLFGSEGVGVGARADSIAQPEVAVKLGQGDTIAQRMRWVETFAQ